LPVLDEISKFSRLGNRTVGPEDFFEKGNKPHFRAGLIKPSIGIADFDTVDAAQKALRKIEDEHRGKKSTLKVVGLSLNYGRRYKLEVFDGIEPEYLEFPEATRNDYGSQPANL